MVFKKRKWGGGEMINKNQEMTRQITFNISEMPKTCFDCLFAARAYCYAACPFLNTVKEDGEKTPKDCPLKLKNVNKAYNFHREIYRNL